MERRALSGRDEKLPGKDSNLEWESQNLQCYRYTTRY